MESWPEHFKEFFGKVDSTLGQVFEAGGLREVWLQGEFFRYFYFEKSDKSFKVNHSLSNTRIKHDLYSEFPAEMVAEIKVYGLKGFQSKNLDGSSVKKYIKELSENKSERLLFYKTRIGGLKEMGEGTYLSDVRRLHDITQPIEKYMILVLQKLKEDPDPDEFGKVIQRVKVSESEFNLCNLTNFFVRISKI